MCRLGRVQRTASGVMTSAVSPDYILDQSLFQPCPPFVEYSMNDVTRFIVTVTQITINIFSIIDCYKAAS